MRTLNNVPINEALAPKSALHDALLKHCKDLVKMSRDHMSKSYTKWDDFDNTYRGQKASSDKADANANNRKEPEKMVVPVAYAQVQTFVAFCYSLFTQREYFFELLGYSPADENAADLGEALLQHNLDHNKFNVQLYQYLLDIARYGVGIMKCYWVEETQMITDKIAPRQLSVLGMFKVPLGREKVGWRKAIKYQGNKLLNVSPYRFFPDPRFPISRFQEGEFVASDDVIGYNELKRMESEGTVFNIDYIQKINASTPEMSERLSNTRVTGMDVVTNKEQVTATGQSKGTMLLTEVQVKLVPKNFMINEKTPMGPEDYPVKYLVWYANDSQIIRCEPLSYVHDRFTYEVAEFNPDQNHFMNNGLSETIDQLQSVISWFINSHITSVRKVIQNYLVVDPEGVNMDDLKNRRPVIRMNQGAARNGGVERWIKQLQVQDTTSGHMSDAQVLQQTVQMVTGINENLLGQFHSGRRSATEARNVSGSAAARLKMLAGIIFASGLEPLGRQMLTNLRDGLTEDTYVRQFGSSVDPQKYMSFKKVNREDLTGNYDFGVFDGTLPSEKGYLADVLKEVVLGLFQNPEAIPLLGLDPKAMTYEMLKLKGIRYPERFALGAAGVMPPAMQPPVAQPMPGQQPPPQPNGQQPQQPSQFGASALPFAG